MIDDQRAIYTALVSTRNNEVTLRWTRTQLFFLIHSAALSLVNTSAQFKIGTPLHIFACAVGITLGLVWYFTTIRAREWLDYWDTRLAALERAQPQSVMVFGGPEYAEVYSGFRIHHILLTLVGIFVIIWVVLGSISALTFLSKNEGGLS